MSRALQFGVIANQGASVPAPLFTYDALAGSRSSERAFYDPRTPGFDGGARDLLSLSARPIEPDGATGQEAATGVDADLFAWTSAPWTITVIPAIASGVRDMWILGIGGGTATTGLAMLASGSVVVYSSSGSTDVAATGGWSGGDLVEIGYDPVLGRLTVWVNGSVVATDPSTSTAPWSGLESETVYVGSKADGTSDIFDGAIFPPSTWRDANVLRDDVLAIDPVDGSLVIEEARANAMPDSSLGAGWSGTSGTPAASAKAAPDGGVAYETEDSDAGAAQYLSRSFNIPATGSLRVSLFIEQGTGLFPMVQMGEGTGTYTSGPARLQINADTGAHSVLLGSLSDISVTSVAGGDWWLVQFKIDASATGSATMRCYPSAGNSLGSIDASATGTTAFEGMQIEPGEWPTSPIRTVSGAASRLTEYGVLASASVPATMRSGKFTYQWTPSYSSAERVLNGTAATHFAFGGGSASYAITTHSTGEIRVRETTQKVVTSGVTYNAGDTLTITIDAAAGTIEIAGALTGNGVHSGTPWTMPAGDMWVGGSTSTQEETCVLGQVFAA